MALTTLPTRASDDLGPALADTRTPRDNEPSAVNYEKIKDRVIQIGTDLGTDSAPASDSVKGRLDVIEAKLDTVESSADVTDAANVAAAGAVMDSDFAGSATGTLLRTGAGTYATQKDVLNGSGAPDANDDNTQGYSVGSRWIDTTSGHIYICVDATTGDAEWPQVDGAGGGGGSGDVVGPASATDNAIARFDDTSGELIKNSTVTINDDGDIATTGTVCGRDLATDGSKLDGIQANADVTDAANVAAAGAVMTTRTISTTSPLTGGGALSSNLTLAIPPATTMVNGYATTTQITKLDGIEDSADVTDATNVEAAGAIMDGDFAGSNTGTLLKTGSGSYNTQKDVLNASAAPDVDDDVTQGFIVGSRWIDTTADHAYVCLDSSTGAAVWAQIDGGGGGGSGDVVGPASASDGSIAVFDGTSGTLLKDGGVVISAGLVAGRDVASDGAKLDTLAATSIDTLSGTSLTVADSDNGKIYRCTNGSTVTISVPTGLTPGVTVEFLQEGAGQVQFVGTGSPGLTLRHPAAFSPYTRAQWSTVVVTILDSDEAVLRGHLA